MNKNVINQVLGGLIKTHSVHLLRNFAPHTPYYVFEVSLLSYTFQVMSIDSTMLE